MQTDFNHLYSTLGLQPGCSLHEFKQAYRRQFAQLHPDRITTRTLPDDAQQRLRQVIALYGDALNFHRRYGRLPGALAARTDGPTLPEPPGMAGVSAHGPDPHRSPTQAADVDSPRPGGLPMVGLRPMPSMPDTAQSPRRRLIATILLLVCVGLLLVVWNMATPTRPQAAPAEAPAQRVDAPASASGRR